MSNDRIYSIIYTDPEDGVDYTGLFPEVALPDIEDIVHIEVCGRLTEGWKVVVDEDPDPKEKDPVPIPLIKEA